MTKYLVLKRNSSGWEEGVTVEASSGRAALNSALLNEKEGGEFVAVPARSWKPVKVEVAQALKFS
jgi:hypothetical protein